MVLPRYKDNYLGCKEVLVFIVNYGQSFPDPDSELFHTLRWPKLFPFANLYVTGKVLFGPGVFDKVCFISIKES